MLQIRVIKMKYNEYIEQQMSIIRFSGQKPFELAKLEGVLDFLRLTGVITDEEQRQYMGRAVIFYQFEDEYKKQISSVYFCGSCGSRFLNPVAFKHEWLFCPVCSSDLSEGAECPRTDAI